MSTPLLTRVGLKVKKIARDLTESSEEREWRQIWTQIHSIEGWLYESEGKYLFNAARSLANGTNIVEIGSFKGRSTCCLAAGCRGTQKRVFAIDAFDGGVDLPNVNTLPDFSRNLRDCGVSSYVEPVVGLSGKVAQSWCKPIHLLFIDGSHAYEDVLADFAAFSPHVAPGGIIAFHDVINETWPGVAKAWAEIKSGLTSIGYCESLGFGQKPDSKAHS
jgi:predicted O-methyltransferase YrrM